MSKERPILFNGEMVKAILRGRKTQTRRVVRPGPYARPQADFVGGHWWYEDRYGQTHRLTDRCPYGQPGDLLWVRETWRPYTAAGRADAAVQYRADSAIEPVTLPEEYIDRYLESPPRWKPSIHMPKWAARIWLRVVDVRVERLQRMREADALDEGIRPRMLALMGHESALVSFALLWDRLNGPRGYTWERNPWVWVIQFERMKEAAGADPA